MNIHERHLELVDAVNDAATYAEHSYCSAILTGFRDGIRTAGKHLDLIACDLHTMEKHGEDREMVCGELLDWKPKEQP